MYTLKKKKGQYILTGGELSEPFVIQIRKLSLYNRIYAISSTICIKIQGNNLTPYPYYDLADIIGAWISSKPRNPLKFNWIYGEKYL